MDTPEERSLSSGEFIRLFFCLKVGVKVAFENRVPQVLQR